MSENGWLPTASEVVLYKGRCPHASWWSLVDQPFARAPYLEVRCPATCGIVRVPRQG